MQQAALKQTGKSSFVDGLTYDNEKNLSVTAQEKMYLYQNAIDYSKAHDLQLGAALTQEQINALDKPMLWYVEQTVPDPTCHATGTATCPTITALMPQVYLPVDTQAMSAGGNISGHDVTLKFNQDGNGSILNTGSITASGTLSVDTHTLTNQANQVDVGEIWQKVDGGYLKTTGTVVQPGGFMSAANMDLNVQTLNQIGGALQKLNADGTVDATSTQAMLASLQHQLGGGFTQETVADHLHSEFVQQGGFGPEQLFSMAAAVALSAMGMPVVGAMVSSASNQAFSDQGFSLGEVLKAGVVADLTQGLMAGLDLNALPMQTIGNNIASNTITSEQILQGAFEIAGRGLVSATVNTVAYGGSFGTALKGSVVSDLAAVAASAIGQLNELHFFGEGDLGKAGYVAAHAALGCAASAASGTGCAGGAIGGAVSAGLNPIINSSGALPPAALAVVETFVSGSVAGALGFNVQGAVTAAQNETLNNFCEHNSCGRALAAVGAAVGGGAAAAGSVVVDAATGGLNVVATPAEVAAGATVGAAVGGAIGSGLDWLGAHSGAILSSGDDSTASAPESPTIDPADVAGKTPEEIDQHAKDSGLIPKGPNPQGGQGAYVDPVTGEQRILIHPADPCPHCHVNNPSGERLDINGNPVAPESPAAHLPLNTK
ncbi:DUF637 domain-containing protein [Burkholderia sp. AU19243]|uniref:DUF637 domain-containing protein n=1 Tax=Burkholderia sp. AU19243 TaxID=2824810 RepID=UPI0020127251|nr:DUF637 domain-containing protein [Burkholderia sp. AU19243]